MKNMFDLTQKNALITGGSRGVGRETARLLAQSGADVGFTFFSRQKEAETTLNLIKSEGSRGWMQQVDLTSENDIHRLFERVDHEFPDGIDIFIANAGIWPVEDIPIWEMSSEQWRQTIATNLDAVFITTKEAGKRMRQNGRIVYVSSTAGQRGEAFHVDYAASKGALIAMVKGLCVEYAPRQITVNAVAPGWIDTEMAAPALVGEKRKQIEQSIPLKRIATATDVAGPILFLCTELARHITGEIINVNGGTVLCG